MDSARSDRVGVSGVHRPLRMPRVSQVPTCCPAVPLTFETPVTHTLGIVRINFGFLHLFAFELENILRVRRTDGRVGYGRPAIAACDT